MEYRRLGRSGLEVSVVGMGTNSFGGRVDAPEVERIVRQAVDAGVNFLDTSNSYGRGLSEEYLGKAIKGLRSQVVVATKVSSPVGKGPNQRGSSRKHILEEVDKSLKRLDTDYIDLYQMHYPDPDTPIEETLRALDGLVHQGKVRYIGCSNFAAWQVVEALYLSQEMHLEPFITVQTEYSMLNREIEKELMPCCRKYGLGILPYYPLAHGFLTGKYREGQPLPEGTRLAGRWTWAREQVLTETNFGLLERLEAFVAERGHTILELAIAWLLAEPLVASVIAGVTRPEQVAANASAASWSLSPEDKGEVGRILESGRGQD